jgi:hypothetical protein
MRETTGRDRASSAAVQRPHTTTTIIRRALALGGALLIVTGASACGGDDDDSSSATTAAVSQSTEAPVATAPTTAGGALTTRPPSTDGAAPATTASAPEETAAVIDVCSLVTAEDVAAITGQPITNATSGPAFETCTYGTSADPSDVLVSVAVYPAMYYDQKPQLVGETPTPVDGHTDTYSIHKEDVLKWGDNAISVVDLTFSDAPVQFTAEQLAQIGELLRA